MDKSDLPFTEQSNDITRDIDVASAEGIVQLLYDADKQLFQDKQQNMGILETDVEKIMERIVAIVCEILQMDEDKNGAIVLSGCGTSGRLAFITAKTFNKKLLTLGRRPVFHYLIAGDDEALLLSKELTEDDPHVGRMDLEKLTHSHDRVLYIGITCGLSAAYVAGQLDFCLQNLNRYTPVLMGFNPIDRARNSSVENWDKTFLQVAQQMSATGKDRKAFVLNPLIGAEPITGSTRMKSGSSTKILLESIFSSAVLRIMTIDCSVRSLMMAYQQVEAVTFEQVDNLARIIALGGQCMNSGGHIYYLSDDDLGIIGLIDASECTPTFGADVDDVRGFIVGGYATLKNKQGDLSDVLNISLAYFEEKLVPLLTDNDLLIVISGGGDLNWLSETVLKTKAKMVLLRFSDSTLGQNLPDNVRHHFTIIHSVNLPWMSLEATCSNPTVSFCSQLFKEIACKWTCNTISTGAHIFKGKVYENFMIDVMVRNNKLFHRAISLIQKFGSCSKDEALTALLKSIHNTDTLDKRLIEMPISDHIRAATDGQKIVSTAIIIARQHCAVDKAKKLLSDHPVIRTAIASCLNH